MKKIIVSILLVCMVFAFVGTSKVCYADERTTDSLKNFNSFDDASNEKSGDFGKMAKNASQTAVAIIRVVAATVAIVMLLVVAVKYMMSAPGDRADLKKHLPVYLVGAILCFGVSGILTIISDIASTI